ncbi:MAG: ATP-binding protein [Bacteroidota bacterium]
MKTHLLLFVCLFASSDLLGQSPDPVPYIGPGAPVIQYVSPLDYQASPLNHEIIQANNGILYIGNHDGILEFDGAVWRLIELPNRSQVKSLAINAEGTIYVGGESELGFLVSDSTGQMQYQSLLAEVPEANRDFGTVQRVVAASNRIFFSTSRFLFRWDHASMNIWEPEIGVFLGFEAHDVFFAQEMNRALVSVRNDSLVYAWEGDPFTSNALLGVVGLEAPWPMPYLLLLTTGELLGFDGKNKPMPFQVEEALSRYLIEQQVSSMTALSDGRIAFSTIRGGVLIMNQTGKIDQMIDQSAGLKEAEPGGVYEDNQGGLWIPMSSGLSRVEMNSPVSFFGEAQGLRGGVTQLIQHTDQLYVGNRLGLYRLFQDTASFQTPFFAPVPNIGGGFSSMTLVRDGLFVGTVESLNLIFEDGDVSNSMQLPIVQMHYAPKEEEFLWLGFPDGMALMINEKGKGWFIFAHLPDYVKPPSSIVEDSTGALWIGYGYDGVLQLGISDMETMLDSSAFNEMMELLDLKPPYISYGIFEGVPVGVSKVYKIGEEIVVATRYGLRRFDRLQDRFLPVPEWGPVSMDSSYSILDVAESRDRDIWISYEKDGAPGLGKLALQPDSSFEWEAALLKRFVTHMPVTTFYPDPKENDVLWLGGSEGVFRYEKSKQLETPVARPMLIRRISANGQALSLDDSPPIPFATNNISLQYALPTMIDPEKTRYQFWLEGFDKTWSPWTEKSLKEYNNLSEGRYIFRVRGMDGEGVEYEAGSISFDILPPWYRSWWAYLLYVILLTLAMILIIRQYSQWKVKQLKARNEELEQTVEERTEEIRVKNQALASTLDTLKTTQDQLIMQEKMASLGQMTAGIAHEIKNPLNFIQNFSEVARELASEFEEDLDAYLESNNPEDLELLKETIEGLKQNTARIHKHGERATQIVEGMMDHAQDNEGQRSAIQVNALVEDAVQLAYQAYQTKQDSFHLKIQKELASDLPSLEVNPQDIQRVIINLVNNACHAMDQKAQTVDKTYAPELTIQTSREENHLRIRLKDNGLGIPEDVQTQIFQPFFTTKPTGKGNVGLGLSISYDLITQGYQGSLSCESKPGEYASFEIALPIG